LAAALPTLAAPETDQRRAGSTRGLHPLDGISRENITICDVKVTPMSYELPRDKQWITGTWVAWKTDAVLVQVFTDQGIVGIGESSPYGGPQDIKKFIEEFVRPAIMGKNAFDVEQLKQESNMRLTLDEALELCPVLEELKFLWFEEPINAWQEGAIEGYIRIKGALRSVMVSGGESLGMRFDFKPWIDRNAYDIVQPDCNLAGVSEGWHIARVGNLKRKYCCPHNWHGGLSIMANAALVAAIPNRLVLELNQTYNPLKEDIFKEPLVVKKGYMDLPSKPGFGVELIEDVGKKFPYLPGSYSRPNPELPG
jgi:L-alanine-DL-glutamate epimerase-like enolase superfamily enzyme